MNPVRKIIDPGLEAWQNYGAKVSFLGPSRVKVPRIRLDSGGNKVFVIASGLHLEETSGPFLLLRPKALIPALKPLIKRGINILIYPLINQHGLKFSAKEDERLLRFNSRGIDYNDCWGLKKKCIEVALVEKDIRRAYKSSSIIFFLSLHEDSDMPKKAYVYTNGVFNYPLRKRLRGAIASMVNRKVLATPSLLKKNIQPSELVGASIEDFFLVESRDEGAMEDWLAYSLGVPTILSEAPFDLALNTRRAFHLAVLRSISSEISGGGI